MKLSAGAILFSLGLIFEGVLKVCVCASLCLMYAFIKKYWKIFKVPELIHLRNVCVCVCLSVSVCVCVCVCVCVSVSDGGDGGRSTACVLSC